MLCGWFVIGVVLVEQDRVTVRIGQREIGGARGGLSHTAKARHLTSNDAQTTLEAKITRQCLIGAKIRQ